MIDGKIVKTGNMELINQLEKEGYQNFLWILLTNFFNNIQKQNLDKGGYKFIELFETKFIQEKKLFKSHPDKSNSYYFDMDLLLIFFEKFKFY